MGSPDDLVGDLRLLADAGVDHVTLRFGTADPAPLARFAHEVMPAFAPEHRRLTHRATTRAIAVTTP